MIHNGPPVDKMAGPLPLQARLKSSGIGIGALAAQAGVRPSAVRYYEALGLMPVPARRNGWRVYGMADVMRLRLIAQARGMGFSIRDLKRLAATDRDGLRTAASEKAAAIRVTLHELMASATQLEALAQCDCSADKACVLQLAGDE
jgi:DNA-binding transcriptional MerR regulator